MAIRASSYENKKKERKVQVHMTEEEAKAFLEGDKELTKQLKETISGAVDKAK